MNIYKRIISLFVAFAMCISLMVVPASANALVPAGGYLVSNFTKSVALGAILSESFGFMECSGEYLSTLWDAMNTGVCDGCEVNPNGQHDFMPTDILVTSWEAALRGSEACDCRYCGISYDEFWDSTYNQYVSGLKTDLGTATLINGGIRVYYPLRYVSASGCTLDDYIAGTTTIARVISSDNAKLFNYIEFYYSMYANVVAPFSGTAKRGYSVSVPFGTVSTSFVSTDSIAVSSGTNVYASSNTSYDAKIEISGKPPLQSAFYTASCSYWVDFYPVGDLSSETSLDVSVNSRPTSIVGDYGIIGDDGTIIHVEGNMIVDESTSIVYNPVTNNTYNYTDYSFDYSDRSYNLTLEDGSTLKVVYGDENVTIHEGDTVYNIYYLIPDDSGSGDDPGTGDTPGGEDMSWWKEAWTNFTDKLFSILGNGGSAVNPDNAPAVPDDEETGEKGYSVIDLFVVLKDGTWAFITGIVSTAYDGFTGFVESVSSAGSFFTFYDEESEDGILFVPLEGGETIWD